MSFYKLLLMATVTLSTIFSAKAQKNNVAGYYLTNEGDTVRGRIDDQRWSLSPNQVTFSDDRETKTLTKDNMQGFGIDGGDHYLLKTVTRNTRPVDVNKLKNDDEDHFVTEPLLLRRVVSGKWNLFYANVEKPLFFLQVGTDSLEELQYVIRYDGDGSNYSEHYLFRRQLYEKQSSSGGGDLPVSLAKMSYHESELANYVRMVNGESPVKTPARKQFRFFAGVGMAYNNFSMTGNFAINKKELDAAGTVSPVLQVGVDLNELRNLNRFLFRLELAAFQFKAHHTSDNPYLGGGMSTKVDYELQMLAVQPSVSVLYHFLVYPRQRFYAGGALAYNFSSYNKNRLSVTGPYPGPENVTDPAFAFDKNWVQLYGRLGTVMNDRLDVNLRYSLLGTFAMHTPEEAKPRSAMLQVNYRF